jgi:hypothetical protein
VNLSPTFADRYREQYLVRISKNYAEKTSQQLSQRLTHPNLDPTTLNEIAEDAATAVRIGTELNIPVDAEWKKLLSVNDQVQIIAQLDVRPVITIKGTWQTTDLGKSAPSSAEFKLSNAGSEKILKFIESTKVVPNSASAFACDYSHSLLSINAMIKHLFTTLRLDVADRITGLKLMAPQEPPPLLSVSDLEKNP